MNKKNTDKKDRFTSAMGDLKGLLDKEGITVGSANDSPSENTNIPTLNFENNENNIPTISNTHFPETLAEKNKIEHNNIRSHNGYGIEENESPLEILEELKPMTNLEKNSEFYDSENSQHMILKNQLKRELSIQIEQSVNELKQNLLDSLTKEVDRLFK